MKLRHPRAAVLSILPKEINSHINRSLYFFNFSSCFYTSEIFFKLKIIVNENKVLKHQMSVHIFITLDDDNNWYISYNNNWYILYNNNWCIYISITSMFGKLDIFLMNCSLVFFRKTDDLVQFLVQIAASMNRTNE